jgi:hypothetical protein
MYCLRTIKVLSGGCPGITALMLVAIAMSRRHQALVELRGSAGGGPFVSGA